MFFNLIKQKKNEQHRGNSISLCIWGNGPGRPFDNAYSLLHKEEDNLNKTIKLFFEGNEECVIESPLGVSWKGNCLRVICAEKITWKFYLYGKIKTNENLYIIEYYMLTNLKVKVVTTNNGFLSDKIINVNDKIAFDSM